MHFVEEPVTEKKRETRSLFEINLPSGKAEKLERV